MTGRQVSAAQQRAADGRVPGQRGMATRRRLLEETNRMLADTPYRNLTVVDIARSAGTSPAAFYQYFADAPAAVLTLAQALVSEGEDRLAKPVIEGDWRASHAYSTCEEIAASFLDFWDDHGSLLAVMDLAALEGDTRFREARTAVLSSFTEALAGFIATRQSDGGLPAHLDPTATAAVLVAMLAHVSGHRYGIEAAGTSGDAIRLSMARILHAGITGEAFPS